MDADDGPCGRMPSDAAFLRKDMQIIQQTPKCSDFDVTPDGMPGPAFRVLLPEWIQGKGIRHKGLFHIVPGIWSKTSHGLHGVFSVDRQLELAVGVEPHGTAVLVTLGVRNIGDIELRDLWADVCTSLNHLPGNPGWSNAAYLGDAKLDRSEQGRYWYNTVTPRRLQAFTARGWIPMHPAPDAPDADMSPMYRFDPSKAADAFACAVESPDGSEFCFQAWDTPCRYCTPCSGNACMHLKPFLTDFMKPRTSATIRGMIGIHRGNRAGLEANLEAIAHPVPRQSTELGTPLLPGL